jgi:metalloprotease
MPLGNGDHGTYYIRDRNRVSGPFDVETLARFAKGQRLARHHQLSVDRLTWARAIDLLPDVFSVAVPQPDRDVGARQPMPEEKGIAAPSPVDEGSDVPDRPRSSYISWPTIATAAACLGLAFLGCLAWFMVTVLEGNWSEDDIKEEFSPKITVIQGTRPGGDKASCFGVVVSRHHVVAPLAAVVYRSPKIESVTNQGDRDWHSASLVLVDPDSKLAVFRTDLGQGVSMITIPDERRLPNVNDDLYLVAPDRSGIEAIYHAELDQVVGRGEPDEVLAIGLKGVPVTQDSMLGRAVVDEKGRFSGLVVGMSPEGRAICTAANAVRVKRTEAKKMPPDFAIAPLGEEAIAQGMKPRPAVGAAPPSQQRDDVPNPAAAVGRGTPQDMKAPLNRKPAANTTPGRAEPTETDAIEPSESKSSDNNRNADGRTSAARSGGLIGALGEAGAGIVSDVTDAVTPPLEDTKARELGRNHLDSILSEHERCRDSQLIARVQRLCADVLRGDEDDLGAYTVTVISDPAVNAYAFVGKNLVVTTGFLEFAGPDDDMIRFVIAHEIGHVVLGHTDEPYRRQEFANALVSGGRLAAGFAQAVFKNSPMNQAQEKAADCFAVRRLRSCALSIEGGIRFFTRIDSDLDYRPNEGAIGSLFSSHPNSAERIETISSPNLLP